MAFVHKDIFDGHVFSISIQNGELTFPLSFIRKSGYFSDKNVEYMNDPASEKQIVNALKTVSHENFKKFFTKFIDEAKDLAGIHYAITKKIYRVINVPCERSFSLFIFPRTDLFQPNDNHVEITLKVDSEKHYKYISENLERIVSFTEVTTIVCAKMEEINEARLKFFEERYYEIINQSC